MFGFVTTALGWLFSSVFGVVFYLAENIVEWILPIYMTIYILHRKDYSKYNNYICFWCLAAILYLIDYLTFFGLHYIFFYRLFRFIFLSWIQIDYCHNSVFLIQYIAPVIDQHRESVGQTFNKIGNQVDSTYSNVMNNAKNKISEFINNSNDNLIHGVVNAMKSSSSSSSNTHTNANANTNTNTNTINANTNTNTINANANTKTSFNTNSDSNVANTKMNTNSNTNADINVNVNIKPNPFGATTTTTNVNTDNMNRDRNYAEIRTTDPVTTNNSSAY